MQRKCVPLNFVRRCAVAVASLLVPAAAIAELPAFQQQEIASDLGVGYAVTLVDLSGDGRLDIVVVDQKRKKKNI